MYFIEALGFGITKHGQAEWLEGPEVTDPPVPCLYHESDPNKTPVKLLSNTIT